MSYREACGRPIPDFLHLPKISPLPVSVPASSSQQMNELIHSENGSQVRALSPVLQTLKPWLLLMLPSLSPYKGRGALFLMRLSPTNTHIHLSSDPSSNLLHPSGPYQRKLHDHSLTSSSSSSSQALSSTTQPHFRRRKQDSPCLGRGGRAPSPSPPPIPSPLRPSAPTALPPALSPT